ncbi:MAG: hypothetical protein QXO03_00200 [Thermoplasmatales archaeon]
MKIVVDTSSFFNGFLPDGSNEYFTTRSVLEEIKGKGMRRSIEMRANFLEVVEPTEASKSLVSEKATETGDISELSSTDIDVLALAVDKNATLITNDLAIQNVCRLIGLRYDSFKSKNIKNEIEWGYRCVGCGRKFSIRVKECPYCGSEIRKYPKKKKKLSDPPEFVKY